MAGLGWRIILRLNIPDGGLVLALAALLVTGISAALALAPAPLILGQDQGRPAWTWGCLAACVPAMTPALAWEQRLTLADGQAQVDLALFRQLIRPASSAPPSSASGREQVGVASGILNTIQQFAGTVGLAALAAVFFAALGPDPATPHTRTQP